LRRRRDGHILIPLSSGSDDGPAATRIAPLPDGAEQQTFECPKCDLTETMTIADPLKSEAVDGWRLMSGRPDSDDLSLGQVAIRVFYCCALTASIAVVTLFIIRFIVGTG
jgi:hypothetical protein